MSPWAKFLLSLSSIIFGVGFFLRLVPVLSQLCSKNLSLSSDSRSHDQLTSPIAVTTGGFDSAWFRKSRLSLEPGMCLASPQSSGLLREGADT